MGSQIDGQKQQQNSRHADRERQRQFPFEKLRECGRLQRKCDRPVEERGEQQIAGERPLSLLGIPARGKRTTPPVSSAQSE